MARDVNWLRIRETNRIVIRLRPVNDPPSRAVIRLPLTSLWMQLDDIKKHLSINITQSFEQNEASSL